MSELGCRVADRLKRWLTLRVQLTLWYVALLGVVLLGFCFILDLSLSARLQRQMDTGLDATQRQVSAAVDLENGRARLGDNTGDIPPGSVVALYGPAGAQFLIRTAPELVATFDRVGKAATTATDGPRTVAASSGQRWRVLIRPVAGEKDVYILVARSADEIEAALGQLMLLEAIVVPLILVLAVGGGLFLAARALSPIDQITRTAAMINETDLGRRLALPSRHDEVGRLAATFDAMLDRLDRAFQRQSQFTADASHELRTPVSIIRSRAEIALDQPRTATEYQQALAVIEKEATRLGGLVSDLMTLARADSQADHLTHEVVALDTLVRGVADQLEVLAEEKHIALVVGRNEAANVFGDSSRLAQLLINLVDNALKHTPEAGSVVIDLFRERAWVVVSIADTGVGIPEEHLSHLFERFYRVDRARSGGGVGLGLAICDWIVRAHRGTIQVTSAVGKGSTFRVRLPVYLPNGARRKD